MVRAKVEQPCRFLKRKFGYVKPRYRGLASNRTQLLTLFALGSPVPRVHRSSKRKQLCIW
ncbi:hypothetical protein [Pararhodobacter sp. SW119]|uniref:hypothetical protein n=1 Tax=Pararhodobacter sp. SW119 TaxID=2780075 RepID=UPI001ADFAF9A|nr:hypothetical protein [Pararhodobacter sp. SW119]